MLGKQVAVALAHRIALMAHKRVDKSLIDAGRREVAREGMPISVKADLKKISSARQTPARSAERPPKASVTLLDRQRLQPVLVADDELAARPLLLPRKQDRLQFGVK